jgi:putative hydrolase of the HAD superfamily
MTPTLDSPPSIFAGIRNVLFDLGGVLYKIEYERVERAFTQLKAPINAANTGLEGITYTHFTQPAVFTQYEIGVISTAEFRAGLRIELGLQASDDELDAAWNSMLLGVYDGREQLLALLKPRFNTALLSNTNALHIAHVQEQCAGIFSLLDHLFFSYKMGTRKPEPEIFRMTLDIMGWAAHETLFIDDSPQHLRSAQQLGIHTLWLQNADDLPHTAQMLISTHTSS